jgi:hypothetical protein
MTRKHPWLALLGFFPVFYVLGVVRFWGKPWCTWDGGFFPISSPLPTLWWPVKLYQYRKRNSYYPWQ